jgi:ATP-binding cassette subfamily C (CFTR/MRP) protein 1
MVSSFPIPEPSTGSTFNDVQRSEASQRRVTIAHTVSVIPRHRPLLVPRGAPPRETSETRANIFSRAFLVYLRHVQKTAEAKDAELEVGDIDPVPADDSCERTHERFAELWACELDKVASAQKTAEASGKTAGPAMRPSLLRVLNALCAQDVCLIVLSMLFEMGLPFTTVILLGYIDTFMNDASAPLWHGAIFAAVVLVSQILRTICAAQSARFSSHVGVKFEGAVRMAVAQRTLGMTGEGFASCGGTGAAFQIFAADVSRLGSMLTSLYQGVALGAQALAAIIYLFCILTWPACGAVAVIVVILPFNYGVSRSFMGVFLSKMIAGDERTKKVVEILNNIRTVKMYGWQKPFVDLVGRLREPELGHTARLMRLQAFVMSSYTIAAPLMQLAVYGLILAQNPRELDVVKFFQSLSLISILANSLCHLPWVYSSYLQLLVSANRITSLLLAETRDAHRTIRQDGYAYLPETTLSWTRPEPETTFSETTFSETTSPVTSCDSTVPFELKIDVPSAVPAFPTSLDNHRLRVSQVLVEPGELAVIVGKLGAGKSSMISALLGEMHVVEGTRTVRGRVAYTPQQAWIINATVRNNIIMNNKYDAYRYDEVVRSVDLHVDFPALPNGDLTEIGEKGVNLSGGQKQRVSLARALYTDADLYLFDDPLSALDAHVGRHVFDAAIMKLLAGKTRVLVTHALGFVGAADRVYVADDLYVRPVKDFAALTSPATSGDDLTILAEPCMMQLVSAWRGTITPKGSYPPPQVLCTGKLAATLPAATLPARTSSSSTDSDVSELIDQTEDVCPFGMDRTTVGHACLPAAQEEQQFHGEERQSGRVRLATLLLYLNSFGGTPFWVTLLLLYVVVVGGNLFANLWLGFWAGGELPGGIQDKYEPGFYVGVYAAIVGAVALVALGRELLWSRGAVNAPRVIYRQMSDAVFHTTMSFFDTTPIGRIITRFTNDPEQLDFALPTACNTLLLLTLQQLGTLVAVCVLMPWFTPVAVVLVSAMVVLQPTVATIVLRRLSNSLVGPTVALYSEMVSGGVCVRAAGLKKFFLARFAQSVDDAHAARIADQMLLQAINVKMNVCMAFVACASMLIIMATKHSLTSARASFIVSQVMNITLTMAYMMFERGQLALALNSIERITEYSALPAEPEGHEEPPAEWPVKGDIEFDHITAQYRPGKPCVLKDVSVKINAGEKIGVVGRTGSGKSTLLLTVFRLIPLLDRSSLKIDGVDTATMPLATLRNKLSAIPQEPVLFTGTVRENLDPFGTVEDSRLRDALQQANLVPLLMGKAVDAGIDDYLSLPLEDSSLSVGEKQLLCLARALARNQRILVLDEATSSVDPHTDSLIQSTIRTAFAHCTVLTVAHRLNTIMDSDRILVLDNGNVAQYDSPARLLDVPHGIFARLVADAERARTTVEN